MIFSAELGEFAIPILMMLADISCIFRLFCVVHCGKIVGLYLNQTKILIFVKRFQTCMLNPLNVFLGCLQPQGSERLRQCRCSFSVLFNSPDSKSFLMNFFQVKGGFTTSHQLLLLYAGATMVQQRSTIYLLSFMIVPRTMRQVKLC